jgi:hypothetical protein
MPSCGRGAGNVATTRKWKPGRARKAQDLSKRCFEPSGPHASTASVVDQQGHAVVGTTREDYVGLSVAISFGELHRAHVLAV